MTVSDYTEKKAAGDNYYRQGVYGEAIKLYSAAIDILHNNRDEVKLLCTIYSNRCACHMQENSNYTALDDAKKCTELQPHWFKGHNRVGACLKRMNKNNEAIASYERALQYDSGNVEALQALRDLRRNTEGRSFNDNQSSYGNANANGDIMTSIKTFIDTLIQKVTGFISSAAGSPIQSTFQNMYVNSVMWWSGLTAEYKNYIQIGLVAVVAYFIYTGGWLGFGGRGSRRYVDDSELDYDDRYDSHGGYGGYGYGGGYGGGMSWSTWSIVMAAAWKLPPMFPDLLGEYARPFFGMSWTTFMWLLNMLNGRSGGMNFGGYGRRRRGYY